MKQQRLLASLACCALLASPAIAGTYEWTSGWGMGITEYSVDDGNGNELIISCAAYEEDGYVSAYATIHGQGYGTFDVIVDGEIYTNPFHTDCRVCSDNFRAFWEALRKANNLFIRVDDVNFRLPTTNLSQTLHSLDSELNPCYPVW